MDPFSSLGWSIEDGEVVGRFVYLLSLTTRQSWLSSVTSAFTKLRSQLLRSGIIIKCLVVMCSDCGDDSAVFFLNIFSEKVQRTTMKTNIFLVLNYRTSLIDSL